MGPCPELGRRAPLLQSYLCLLPERQVSNLPQYNRVSTAIGNHGEGDPKVTGGGPDRGLLKRTTS